MHFCMDWRAIKFDWNRARAFWVAAEEGSLSAGARALGVAQPTLGRQVDALEAELGVLLFERNRKGLDLTPAGVDLLEHMRAMGEAAQRVSLSATGQSQTIEGSVAITASEVSAAYLLPPIIAKLREIAPGISIELIASNSVQDLRRREADIALRNTAPTQNELISQKLCMDLAHFYASRDYMDQIGPIRKSSDLSRASIIGIELGGGMQNGLVERGFDVSEANFPVVSKTHTAHIQLARHGVGIGIFPDWAASQYPDLVRVSQELPPLEFPMYLVAHRELITSRRVRLVYDLLAHEVRAKLAETRKAATSIKN